MSAEIPTFGYHLLRFSLAVDIVDDNTFENVIELITNYAKTYLGFIHVSFKRRGMLDENVCLTEVFGRNKGKNFSVYKNEKITGQTTYAFAYKKKLWIVDKNEKDLNKVKSEHIDLWSSAEDLPQSIDQEGKDIKTRIIFPIIRKYSTIQEPQAVGVVEFETVEYIKPNKKLKKEIEYIAESLSRIQYLNRTLYTLSENTKNAMENLKNYLNEAIWPDLTKPQIFVAFPSKSDSKVIGQIKYVLDEFEGEGKVDLFFWDKWDGSGKIDQNINQELSRSKIGVCYFSEKIPRELRHEESEHKYIDNSNVLFEAGMLQALYNSPREKLIGWVPIREEKSPKTPFDFKTDNMIIVDRLHSESLNEAKFSEKLRDRINNLLKKIYS